MEDEKFAVTGEFLNITRDELERFIMKKGGRIQGGVSTATDYLIAGNRLEDGRDVTTSGKFRKA